MGGDEPVVEEEAGLVVAHMISPAEDSQLLNEVLFATTVLPRETQAAPTPSADEEIVEKWSRRCPSAPPPARRPTTWRCT